MELINSLNITIGMNYNKQYLEASNRNNSWLKNYKDSLTFNVWNGTFKNPKYTFKKFHDLSEPCTEHNKSVFRSPFRFFLKGKVFF